MQMCLTADSMGGNQGDRLRLPMRLLICPDVYVPPAAKKLMQLSINPGPPRPLQRTRFLPRGICTFPPESAVTASEITQRRAADLAPFLLCGLASSCRNKELLRDKSTVSENPDISVPVHDGTAATPGDRTFPHRRPAEPAVVSPHSNTPIVFFNGIKGRVGGTSQHMADRARRLAVSGRHLGSVHFTFIRKAPVTITAVLRSYSHLDHTPTNLVPP